MPCARGERRRTTDWAIRFREVHVHRAVVVVRLNAARRPIDELVWYDERARPELRAESADCAGREDLAYPDAAKRPEVRAIRDPVGRVPMVGAMPRQERNR